VDAAHIATLLRDFMVSAETMLRRLQGIGAFDSGDYAPVLTRKERGNCLIEYAVYPPWLKSHLLPPKRGDDFAAWFHPSDPDASTWQRRVTGGVLTAKSGDISSSLRVLEIAFSASATETSASAEAPDQR
jgi:hypothetical protein